MSFDAGAIVGKLNLDLSNFTAGVAEAAAGAAGFPAIGELMAGALKGVTGAAIEMGNKLREIFTDVAHHARAMGSEAEKAGVSVEFLSTVGKVAPSVEALSDSLKFLGKNLAETAEGGPQAEKMAAIFGKVGISMGDLKSAMANNDLEGLFFKAADGMKGLGSSAEKTRVAMELFGRGGTERFQAEGRDFGVAFVDLEEAEQAGGIDDRKQVVDLEGEVVGEAEDIVLPVVVD